MNDMFEKAIRDAIIREYAGDIYRQMAEVPIATMPHLDRMRDLRVPLTAEASVLFDRIKPQVLFRAEGWSNTENGERLGIQKVFSYQDIPRSKIPGMVAALTGSIMNMVADQLMRGSRSDGK